MKYFAVFLPMLDEEKSKEYRPVHVEYLEQKRAEEKTFAFGRFADGTGGLIIYRADSFEEVEEMVKQDPFIKHGARRYQIHEWEMSTDAVLPY